MRCVLSAVSSIGLLAVAGASFYLHYWIAAAIFMVVGIIFAYMAVTYGAIIHIDDKGFTHKIFGFTIRHLDWNEVREIGVLSTKLYGNKGRVDTLNIYMSPVKMTEDDCFNMVVRWPPTKISYLAYSKVRLEKIQILSDKPVKNFNTDKMNL